MRKWLLTALLAVATSATAAGLDDLKTFLNTTQTATGAF